MQLKTKIAALLLSALPVLMSPAAATAAAPNAGEMEKLNFMVGTWDCRWTAGNDAGAIVATFTPVMGGAWIEETEAVEVNGKSYVQTMHFTGYDPKLKLYVHAGPNADGTYEVAQSADLTTWNNVLPKREGSGTLDRLSDSEYVLSEDFQSGGKTLTYRNDCKKRSS